MITPAPRIPGAAERYSELVGDEVRDIGRPAGLGNDSDFRRAREVALEQVASQHPTKPGSEVAMHVSPLTRSESLSKFAEPTMAQPS